MVGPPVFRAGSCSLNKRKIKLCLMNGAVGVEVDVAKICLDLVEDSAFGIAQSFRHVRMNAECCMTNVFDLFRQAASFGKYFVADGSRRFYPTRALTIVTRRAHRAFE